MAKKNITVVINRNTSEVKLFNNKQAALDFVGPEYDKKGFDVTEFEKKVDTYFSVVEEESTLPGPTTEEIDKLLKEQGVNPDLIGGRKCQ